MRVIAVATIHWVVHVQFVIYNYFKTINYKSFYLVVISPLLIVNITFSEHLILKITFSEKR
jgi:hypothetical protein